MNQIISKLKSNRGFVLLFAMTLAGVLLTIALSVSNIALQELRFNVSGKNSNEAFFAADTGSECALYEDTQGKFPAQATNPNLVISCNGGVAPTFSPISSTHIQYSYIHGSLGSQNNGCARVVVDKEWFPSSSIVNTVVTTRGYNLGGALCNSTSAGLIERELEVEFGTHRNVALGKPVTALIPHSSIPGYANPVYTTDPCTGGTSCNLTDGSDSSVASPGGISMSYEVDLAGAGPAVSVSIIQAVIGENGFVYNPDPCPYPTPTSHPIEWCNQPRITSWQIEGDSGSGYTMLSQSPASPNGIPNSTTISVSLPGGTTLKKIKFSAQGTYHWLAMHEVKAY